MIVFPKQTPFLFFQQRRMAFRLTCRTSATIKVAHLLVCARDIYKTQDSNDRTPNRRVTEQETRQQQILDSDVTAT